MLQAMNTGHDGSISTIHANTARDSLTRLEMMLQMAGLSLPMRAMRQQIASALDVIVHTGRLSDGTRKVLGVSEVVGMEGDAIQLQELFVYERRSTAEDGKIIGDFVSTGIRPSFLNKLKASSHDVDLSVFEYLK
jgi:pilus assembly protein CpaF